MLKTNGYYFNFNDIFNIFRVDFPLTSVEQIFIIFNVISKDGKYFAL